MPGMLLHVCCGPCLSGTLEGFTEFLQSPRKGLFWFNPNIHPYLEYKFRLESFQKMASIVNCEVHYSNAGYGLNTFLAGLQSKDIRIPRILPTAEIIQADSEFRQERCAFCYEYRLGETARSAAELGYDSFSTTLLISPYQDQNAIERIGTVNAEKYGVGFIFRDLRPFYPKIRINADRYELYRQKYCGCIFSEHERYAGSKKHRLPLP